MSAVAVQLEAPALAWIDVCALDDILPDTGAAALVGGRQIAIVRVGDGDGEGAEVYALDNFDPFSHAFVIARGIVGDRAGVPKIASPIFKQSFDLGTGQCLDDPAVRLASYPVRVAEGRIMVAVPSDAAARGT
jgi:nitrite reductase (NADH) small subunit